MHDIIAADVQEEQAVGVCATISRRTRTYDHAWHLTFRRRRRRRKQKMSRRDQNGYEESGHANTLAVYIDKRINIV